MYANETLAITAGGLYLKVWDLLGGGRLLASLSNHHKSILCTGFTSEQNYILSGGLDRHVKIYDASTFRVVHTITYPDAVLSLAMVGPNDRALCVGMPGGLWSVKRRDGTQQILNTTSSIPMPNGYDSMNNNNNGNDLNSSNNSLVPIDDESTNDTKSTASSGSRKTKSRRRFYPSGKYQKYSFILEFLLLGIVTPTITDPVATANRRPRLAPYDNYLRKFRASAALDAAFTSAVKRRQPDIVLALFKELSRRQMLKQALAGRDDLSLLKILRYLHKHIAHTTYMPVLIEVAHIISHLYDFSSSISDKNNKAMEKLQRTIQDELQFQLELMKTKGAIEIILAAASASTLLETNTTTNNNNNNNNTVISSL
jgi:U3 small nucleolar RNA-associated protein 15